MLDIIKNIVRLLQLFWALLLTALIGNVIASNISAASSSEAAVNFAMFATVVAWLAAVYGLASNYVASIAMAIVLLALDGAATLFTAMAGIVLAAKLKVINCGGSLDPKDLGDDWIGFGTLNNEKRCREIQAGTTFMWFLFACFAVSLFFTATSWKKGGGSVGSRSSIGPYMTQV